MYNKVKGITLPVTALGFMAANIDFKESYEDYVDRLTEEFKSRKDEILAKYFANIEEISAQMVKRYMNRGEWETEPLLPPGLVPEEYLTKELEAWPLADRWKDVIAVLVEQEIADNFNHDPRSWKNIDYIHPHRDNCPTAMFYVADLQKLLNSLLTELKEEISDYEFQSIIASDCAFKLSRLRELKSFDKMFPVFRTIREYGPIDPDQPWLDDPDAAAAFNDLVYAEAVEHYPGNGFGVTAHNRRNYCRRMLAENNTKYLGERITAMEVNLEALRSFAALNKFDLNIDSHTGMLGYIDVRGASIVAEIMKDYLLTKLRKGEEIYGYDSAATAEANTKSVYNNIHIEENYLDITETTRRSEHLTREQIQQTAREIVTFFQKMEEKLSFLESTIAAWLRHDLC